MSAPPSPSSGVLDIENTRYSQLPSESGMKKRRCVTLESLATAISTSLSNEPKSYWLLLLLATATAVAGLVASSLLPRSSYIYTDSIYISGWTTTAGWPLTALLLPLIPRTTSPSPPLLSLFTLILWYLFLGILTAVSNSVFVLVYSIPWGLDMKTSTDEAPISSFHGATTAVFAAMLGRWLAGNKVGASGVNAVVLVVMAALAVASEFIQVEKNIPATSFPVAILLLDLPVSIMRGLVLALTERVVRRRTSTGEDDTIPPPSPLTVVRAALEVQLMVSLVAFGVSSIGFFLSGGFGSMKGRSRSYYMVMAWNAVAFQVMGAGGAVVVGLSSTMFGGLLGPARLPLTSLLAIACFHDAATAIKVFGMLLACWGLLSYGFGHLNSETL